MSDSIIDIMQALLDKMSDSENNLTSLLGEDWRNRVNIGDFSDEAHEQYQILLQARKDLLTCNKPTTIIPEIENEENEDLWLGRDKKSYPILKYLKRAREFNERIYENPDKQVDFEEALTKLIKFSYFNPGKWFEKERVFPPIGIQRDEIPTWLSDRYKEAVYSYIYGFNNAAIAMCRSILEGVLDEKIGDICDKKVALCKKIEIYGKTIKDTKRKQVVWSAGKVVKQANDLLHDIKISWSDVEAKEALLQTRNFIGAAY